MKYIKSYIDILENDYQGPHKVNVNDMDYNTTSDNLSKMVPDDIYTHPNFYADMRDISSKESFSILKKIKNKPDAIVTVYRAAPSDTKTINNGDWVTFSLNYAKEHRLYIDGKSKILKLKTLAKNVIWDGNDINEFGLKK